MARVVKILTHDDGTKNENKRWCLTVHEAGTDRTLCEGEAFGIGDSGCEYIEKVAVSGSITCEDCRKKIKWFKSIKL
jgi:hypothetical protein